jgi:pimeloyl-ACP methyl ester carboxylesterase
MTRLLLYAQLAFMAMVGLACSVKSDSDKGLTGTVQADSSGYAEINSVRLYFEIYGKGLPLLYLHGGLSSGRDFEKYIPEFSRHFKVIVVDRRGHGRSYDNEAPYSYASMAEEMNAFLEYLKIDSAFVIGWSDGGVVGYHLASTYPVRVRKLVAVGANTLVHGMTEESIIWITNKMTAEGITNDYPQVVEKYRKVNPDPENFGLFIEKTREMWLHDPYISREDFRKITAPVLLVAGDRDDIRLDHMTEMHGLLRNSQLFIYPNTTHFVFDEYSDTVARVLIEFLKQEVE